MNLFTLSRLDALQRRRFDEWRAEVGRLAEDYREHEKEMTMKHTPGPWKVTTCMDYWVEPVNSDPAKQFVGIAHCGDINWPDYEKMQPEWEANARLIAASPDLLEALKELHAMYAHTWDRVDGALVMIDRGVTRFEKAHEAASAAIARAEGK